MDPTARREKFNLVYLLGQYDPAKAKDAENYDQANIGGRLKQVLALGVQKLDRGQVDAVLTFVAKHKDAHADDPVVQIASAVGAERLRTTKAGPATASVNFWMTPNEQATLPAKERRGVAKLALERLKGTDASEIKAFTQAVKIMTAFGRGELNGTEKTLLDKCLKDLLEQLGANPAAAEFNELAKMILKQKESGTLPDDIRFHLGYHGNALDEGMKKVQDMLRSSPSAKPPTMSQFADTYCNVALKRRETYLIRPSVSGMAKENPDGSKEVYVTISRRGADGKLVHNRIIRKESKQGEVSWYAANVPEGSTRTIFSKLNDLLARAHFLQGFELEKPDTEYLLRTVDLYLKADIPGDQAAEGG